MNQRIVDCLTLAPQLQEVAGLPPRLLSSIEGSEIAIAPMRQNLKSVVDKLGASLVVDLLLLRTSLLRAQGEFMRAQAELAQLKTTLWGLGLETSHYRLYFEEGLHQLVEGDYSGALENFIRSRHLARSLPENIDAFSNAILCLENLGLAFDEQLAECDELFLRARSQGCLQEVAGARVSILGAKMRLNFRLGQITQLLQAERSYSREEIDQPRYTAFWVCELPYHSHARIDQEPEWSKLLDAPYFYQKAFRLRTLQGLTHPSDGQTGRASDWVNRVYLWVWKWLVTPQTFSPERVGSAFGAFLHYHPPAQLAHRLCAEDNQLLRNALQWLSLFDPVSSDRVADLTRLVSRETSQQNPLLELERLATCAFKAARDHKELELQDTLSALRASPLWSSKEVWIADLVRAVFPNSNPDPSSPNPRDKQFNDFSSRLRELIHGAESQSSQIQMTVDLETFTVRDLKSKRNLPSQPLALAIELLNRAGSLSCEEFAAVCFGITRYDSQIHLPRIYNLLNRIKRVLPDELQIKTKEGRIYCEGSWRSVELRRPNLQTSGLRRVPEWNAILGVKAITHPVHLSHDSAPARLRLIPSQVYSRRELEQTLRRPRSTVNRMLADWEHRRWVVRRGKARKTSYVIREEIQI